MKQCENCGAEITDDAEKCSSCGHKVGEEVTEKNDTDTGVSTDKKAQDSEVEIEEIIEEADGEEVIITEEADGEEVIITEEAIIIEETDGEEVIITEEAIITEETDGEEVIITEDAIIVEEADGEEVIITEALDVDIVDKEVVVEKKTKTALVAIIALIAVLIVAGILIFKNIPSKQVDLPDAVMYRLSDNTVRIVSDTLKKPVTIAEDMHQDAVSNGYVKVSDDHKKVAYVNEDNALIIVPVKEGNNITKDMSAGYKVGDDIMTLFGFSEDSKHIAFTNNSQELFVFDGKETTKVADNIQEAIIVSNKYLMYIQTSADNTASLNSWDITSKDILKAKIVVEDVAGFYLSKDKNDATTDEVIYLKANKEDYKYSAFSYNNKTEKVITIDEGVSLGIMVSLGSNAEVIYSVTGPVEGPEGDTSDGEVTDLNDAGGDIELHTLYVSTGGEKTILAENIERFYFYDDKNRALVYSSKSEDGTNNIVYHMINGDAQVTYSSSEAEEINVIIDDKYENMAVIVYDPATESEIKKVMRYSVKGGAVTEIGEIPKDSQFVHDHTIGDLMFYVTTNEPVEGSEEMGDVDLYSMNKDGSVLIKEGVYIPSIVSEYNYPENSPFLYVTDVDLNAESVTGTLSAYDGKDAKEISTGIWVGEDFSIPVKYKSKMGIVYLKDHDATTQESSIYLYNIAKGEETLLDIGVTEIF